MSYTQYYSPSWTADCWLFRVDSTDVVWTADGGKQSDMGTLNGTFNTPAFTSNGPVIFRGPAVTITTQRN